MKSYEILQGKNVVAASFSYESPLARLTSIRISSVSLAFSSENAGEVLTE